MNTTTIRLATPEELELLVRKNAAMMMGQTPTSEAIEDAREFVEDASIVVFPDYCSDRPGYSGRVLVAVYSGSPGFARTFTFTETDDLELVGQLDDAPINPPSRYHTIESILDYLRVNCPSSHTGKAIIALVASEIRLTRKALRLVKTAIRLIAELDIPKSASTGNSRASHIAEGIVGNSVITFNT